MLSVLLTAHLVLAAPFSKTFFFTQPDGTRIEIWGEGNEFHAVFETLDGYTVIFDEALMAYCYARLSSDGNDLASTGTQVQNAAGQALGLERHLRASPETVHQRAAAKYAAWDSALEISDRWRALKAAQTAVETSAELAPPTFPTVGVKVGLTLLVDFTDDVGTVPQAQIEDFCNGNNFTGFGNNGSVKAYYLDNSGGKLTYSNVVTIYIRAPKNKSVYNDVSKDAGLQGRMLIADAVAAMKALPNYATEILPKFDVLTTDGQNRVIALNVFYAGDNGGRWSYGLWPHSWSLANPIDLSAGGKKVFRYQITNIGSRLEIGTFVHENGHMLCGYPDLYDYTGRSAGVGDWCLMASGSWGGGGLNPAQICAYLKRASGWATTIELDSNSSLVASLDSQPGPGFNTFYQYKKTGSTKEYFLVEARHKSGRDSSLPGSGVAIWHVDEDGDNSSVNLNPNTSHNNFEATLMQADNQWHLEKNRNGGDSRDLYYRENSASGYANVLSDTSAPKADWWSGSQSGLVLREFSATGKTMTFIIGANDPLPVITGQPIGVTLVPGQSATFTVTATGVTPITYQWRKDGNPIPGATEASYTIPKVQSSDAGNYSARVTNAYGAAITAEALLTVVPTVPLEYALNNSNQAWVVDWNSPWYGQTDHSQDGIACARSYFIGHGQTSVLHTTVSGPGTLKFWWKVSSEPERDVLAFRYGAVTHALRSGEADWEEQTVYLSAGSQNLEWVYSKDGAGSGGQDRSWLDLVRYAPGATAPFIVEQPRDLTSVGGATVTFEVKAAGTPDLSYQWSFNGTPVPGATGRSHTIQSPPGDASGWYSVRISSPYGAVTSRSALLGVVPLAVAGDNSFGQLAVAAAATNAVGIGAGAWHSLAIKVDGTVLAWGDNWNGQCDVPAGLSGVVAVAGGGYHSLALRGNGTMAGWGDNSDGQLNGAAALSSVTAIAAGTWHSVALRADGTVSAWGNNDWGQTSVPARLSNVVAVAAGGNHSLALRQDGTVVAWGENTDAQGVYVGQSVVPWGLRDVVAIDAGDYHSVAVRADGGVVAWGDNSQGQCSIPAGLGPAALVSAGAAHSIALLRDSTVVSWGAIWSGQGDLPATLTNVTAVATGNAHTLVLIGTPAAAPVVDSPRFTGAQFSVRVKGSLGKRLALEYKDSLLDATWTALPSVASSGSHQTLSDPGAASLRRFYRVRQW